MGTAYQCKEEYTPDGKRLVRRERNIGLSGVAALVAVAFFLLVLILALAGRATVAPISLNEVLDGLRRWLR